MVALLKGPSFSLLSPTDRLILLSAVALSKEFLVLSRCSLQARRAGEMEAVRHRLLEESFSCPSDETVCNVSRVVKTASCFSDRAEEFQSARSRRTPSSMLYFSAVCYFYRSVSKAADWIAGRSR